MEAIDTQRRFEELVSELERLGKAADLIEENASQTQELSQRTKEIVDALDKLVPSVKESVKEGTDALQQEADQLGSLKEDFDTFLEAAESDHQRRLAALSETLGNAVERQKQLLNQHTKEQKAKFQSVREALADTTKAVQSVEEQLAGVREQAVENHEAMGAAFEAMARQRSTERQTLQNAVVHAREQVTSHVNAKQGQFWQRVNAKFERGERAVLALLVLQGLTVALVLLLYLTG